VATNLLTQVIDAIVASLPELIPIAVDAILTIVDTLIDTFRCWLKRRFKLLWRLHKA